MKKQTIKKAAIIGFISIKSILVAANESINTNVEQQCKSFIEQQIRPSGLQRIAWLISDSYTERSDYLKCVREKMFHISYSIFDRQYYTTTRSDSAYRQETHVNQSDAQRTTGMPNALQYDRVTSPTQEIDSKQTLENLPSVRGYETIKGAQDR